MWDSSETPDLDFDLAVQPQKSQFEETAIKHFFRRIALWDASEEELQEEKRRSFFRRRRSRPKSELGMVGKGKGEEVEDRLKEATTREGLAQLLWTLLHDPDAPLDKGLKNECTQALKKKYRMTTIDS
jgi:hypothetical protein